jgi:hypothetical protein
MDDTECSLSYQIFWTCMFIIAIPIVTCWMILRGVKIYAGRIFSEIKRN